MEDEFGDPEGESVADEGFGHVELLDELVEGFCYWGICLAVVFFVVGLGLESVNDASLPS